MYSWEKCKQTAVSGFEGGLVRVYTQNTLDETRCQATVRKIDHRRCHSATLAASPLLSKVAKSYL